MTGINLSGARHIQIFLVVCLLLMPFCEIRAQDESNAIPEKINGRYRISVGNKVMEIDPARGARITSFLIDGVNFLTDSTINDFNWGSTFWLSPQSDWHWPPSAAIDNRPYAVALTGNVIKLISSIDPLSGCVVSKEISGNIGSGSFLIKYRVTNFSGKTTKLAPWEVTRVKTNGLAFFPVGKNKARGGLLASTSVHDGIFWYLYQKEKLPVKGDRQIYADGAEGWLAQVNKDVVLIKKFRDVSPEMTAPKEGEVELFASEVTKTNQGYVEIEHQGPYLELLPGKSFCWETTWLLARLPAGIKPIPGNSALVKWVRQAVQ
ncbi:DUF4380 domain-containing protein [Dyadobacter helix]|nr:DUF4380 domain-containing protein [Dyadobacter sp. CECT 9275]